MFFEFYPMFHVEHRGFMRFFLLFMFSLTLAGCNKPDPNPENKDPIFSDLSAQAEEMKKAAEAEEKQLEEHKKALAEVVPQSGQIKYAQKRVYESEAKIQKLKQEAQWLKVSARERLKQDKINYLKAFNKGEPWPDPKEYAEYKEQMRLRRIKLNWNVKDRMREAGLPVPGDKKPAGGEKKEEKEKKAE